MADCWFRDKNCQAGGPPERAGRSLRPIRPAHSVQPLSPTVRSRGTGRRRSIRTIGRDRKSTRLNSSHVRISYAVFCLKKKKYVEEGMVQNRDKKTKSQ